MKQEQVQNEQNVNPVAEALTDEELIDIADSPECNPNRGGLGTKFDFMAYGKAVMNATQHRLRSSARKPEPMEQAVEDALARLDIHADRPGFFRAYHRVVSMQLVREAITAALSAQPKEA